MKGMCCLGRACLKYSVSASGSFETLSKQWLHSQGRFVVRSWHMGKMSKVWLALPFLPSSTEASLCDSGTTCVTAYIKAAHKKHTAVTPAPSCWQTHCQLVYKTIVKWTFLFWVRKCCTRIQKFWSKTTRRKDAAREGSFETLAL